MVHSTETRVPGLAAVPVLLIHGASGCGKSLLLSEVAKVAPSVWFVDCLADRIPPRPGNRVDAEFVVVDHVGMGYGGPRSPYDAEDGPSHSRAISIYLWALDRRVPCWLIAQRPEDVTAVGIELPQDHAVLALEALGQKLPQSIDESHGRSYIEHALPAWREAMALVAARRVLGRWAVNPKAGD
jgi:hypothetical protein